MIFKEEEWPEVTKCPYYFEFEKMERQNLSSLIPTAPAEAVDLIEKMLVFNPNHRLDINAVLEHPYTKSLLQLWEGEGSQLADDLGFARSLVQVDMVERLKAGLDN